LEKKKERGYEKDKSLPFLLDIDENTVNAETINAFFCQF